MDKIKGSVKLPFLHAARYYLKNTKKYISIHFLLLFMLNIINRFLHYVKLKIKIDFVIYLCYIILIIKYIRFTPDNYIIVIGLFLCY